MQRKEIQFAITVLDSAADLSESDAQLLATARETTQFAYAPYSHFLVGAAAILANHQIVTGTNQENAAYPVGICAERVLMSVVASRYPGEPILSMAISYNNGASDRPISPCGVCRQSLVEYQDRTKTTIRLILSGMSGKVFIIDDARHLLPLSFSSSDL